MGGVRQVAALSLALTLTTLCCQLCLAAATGTDSTAFDLLLQGRSTKRKDLLVYNRVAKTGSSTLQLYMDALVGLGRVGVLHG